jgi:hypothetical protein
LRHSSSLKLCLATVLAMSAVAVVGATSAFAGSGWPAYYECVKTVGGKYTSKACSEEATAGKGKYELKEGVGKGKAFKVKGKRFNFDTVIPGLGNVPVECQSMKGSGLDEDIEGRGWTSNAWWTFSKCSADGGQCSSPGAKKGEIVSGELSYVLGWPYNEHEVRGGDAYQPPKGKKYLWEYYCTALEANVRTEGAAIFMISGRYGKASTSQTDISKVEAAFGEVEPGYTPLVNVPMTFEGESTQYYLQSEINSPDTGGAWSSPIPVGLEGEATEKGENLRIMEGA